MSRPGVRPIVYPGGQYRTSREVAAANDVHSPDRLPEHREFVVSHPSGEGWDELLAEVLKYNAVSEDDAVSYLERLLVDPALAREGKSYTAQVLGVRCRLVKEAVVGSPA